MATHLFVEDVETPAVASEDRHHAERVLRLRHGEALTVSDGRGRWRQVVWRLGAEPEPVSEIRLEAEPTPRITVGFALTKSDKATLVVQKLTECGIDRILPFIAERSVVRWDEDRSATAVARWRKVAREAAMQSHRNWLPTVEPVTTFAEVVTMPGVALAHMDGVALAAVSTFVLVGPEGGWAEAELAADVPRVRLARPALRAETASVAAGVLLAGIRDGIVASAWE